MENPDHPIGVASAQWIQEWLSGRIAELAEGNIDSAQERLRRWDGGGRETRDGYDVATVEWEGLEQADHAIRDAWYLVRDSKIDEAKEVLATAGRGIRPKKFRRS